MKLMISSFDGYNLRHSPFQDTRRNESYNHRLPTAHGTRFRETTYE